MLGCYADEYEIIIIDDGSPDRSGKIADELAGEHGDVVRAIHHPENRGDGAAIKSGIEAARYEWICTVDGDNEYDVLDLEKMLDLRRYYLLIIAFRYKKLYSALLDALQPQRQLQDNACQAHPPCSRPEQVLPAIWPAGDHITVCDQNFCRGNVLRKTADAAVILSVHVAGETTADSGLCGAGSDRDTPAPRHTDVEDLAEGNARFAGNQSVRCVEFQKTIQAAHRDDAAAGIERCISVGESAAASYQTILRTTSKLLEGLCDFKLALQPCDGGARCRKTAPPGNQLVSIVQGQRSILR